MLGFDVQAHKFINAYAAFLKRQGKLPIPGKILIPILCPMLVDDAQADDSASHLQVGLTPSRPAPPRRCLPRTSTGSTSVPPRSPATSTCARPLVLAVSARFTALPRTVEAAPRTTLTPPAASTARSCSRLRRLASWSRMRRREAAASPRPASVTWTVSF